MQGTSPCSDAVGATVRASIANMCIVCIADDSTGVQAAQRCRYHPTLPSPTHECVTPGSQGMVSGRMAPAGSVLSVRKNRMLRPLGSSVVSIWGHKGAERGENVGDVRLSGT